MKGKKKLKEKQISGKTFCICLLKDVCVCVNFSVMSDSL